MNYSHGQTQAQERAAKLPPGTEFYFNQVWNGPPAHEGKIFRKAIVIGHVPGVITLQRKAKVEKSLYKRV
ncbi:MAG: hypothetical protein FWD90_05365 [Defluviitaleaceae bacterium]|nr:hypothetical protein [Defluviitaleaceae bacterium]